MSGLHDCPVCHYRFEDARSLEAHDPCPELDEPTSGTFAVFDGDALVRHEVNAAVNNRD